MTKLIKFNDFVRYANFFYRSLGIRPYDEPGFQIPSRSRLEDLVFYVNLINIHIVLLSEAIFVAKAFVAGDVVVAITTMSYMGFGLLGDSKILAIWLKKRELSKLILELQVIFPCESVEKQQRLRASSYLRQLKIVTISFALLYMLLAWTYNLAAIAQYLIYDCWLQTHTVGQKLPYIMYIPWNWHNHWSYYLLYAAEDLAGYTAAAGQISSDLLLCAIATQVIMHYDHVARSIETYDLRANYERCARDASTQMAQHAEDLKFLCGAIEYHGKILRLSNLINEVFGIPLLFNFLASSFVICFVGFQLSIGNTEREMQIKLLLFLVSSVLQVYLICHYGQLLINASSNIADAAYNMDWSNADLRFKKMLVLVIKRAQTPALLKATSLVNVSRGTMAALMQLSYKFFALLRTMYSD